MRGASGKTGACATSCPECVGRIGRIHLAAGLVLAASKLTVGIVSRSKALAVSAMFALQDSVSAGVMLLGATVLRRPPTDSRPYGFGKVGFIVAGGASILVVSGVVALCGAILHSLLEHRQRVPEETGLWVAFAGVVASWLVTRQASCLARHLSDPMVSAHATSTRSHLVASLVVAAAVMVARTGATTVDLVVAVLEVGYVIAAAGAALKRVVRGLMDASIERERVEALRAAVLQLDEVMEVGSVRAVRSGRDISVCLAVGLSGTMKIQSADTLRDRIESAVGGTVVDAGEVLVELRAAGGNHGQDHGDGTAG